MTRADAGTPAPVATHLSASAPQLLVALQGRGTPVMLSHALGVDLHMWDDFAAALADRHAVLRYDHRGHGGSAVPAGPCTQDELADDAARLIREWGSGPVVFVGLSLGGMVAQGLALRHPDLVRGIVIANSTSQYPPAAREAWAQRIAAIGQGGLAAVVEGTLERWYTPAFRAAHPAVVDRTRRTILRADPAGYLACAHAVAAVDWLERLAQIRCPALVIAGAHDAGAPPAMPEAIAARIPGAQLVTLDAAHLSVAEQPQAFEQAVRRFIDGRCG